MDTAERLLREARDCLTHSGGCSARYGKREEFCDCNVRSLRQRIDARLSSIEAKESAAGQVIDGLNQTTSTVPGSEPAPPAPTVPKLRDKILAEREKGNIVFWGLPGELNGVKLDDFVEQPAERILYDLNRLEEISLTFLGDAKWVNDFAVALTIRKLVEQRDAARSLLAQREELSPSNLVNKASINASDMPHIVVKKLQAAFITAESRWN